MDGSSFTIMYMITVEVYDCEKGTNRYAIKAANFEEAVERYEDIKSRIATNWTRHPAITEEIKHLDCTYDSFNEGCIIVSRV
jgi:pterin-4a-carbinolamine dehydratase